MPFYSVPLNKFRLFYSVALNKSGVFYSTPLNKLRLFHLPEASDSIAQSIAAILRTLFNLSRKDGVRLAVITS